VIGSRPWKSEKGFFASGKNGQWKGKLTEEDLAAFERKMGEMLTDEQIAWLVRG
jgi:aryl sulfotransferase